MVRTLVTGYGPFLNVTENPSGLLAAQLGQPYEILPVAYQAVDEFIQRLDPDSFDLLFMLGVHGRARKIRLEQRARNAIGTTPDATGFVPNQRRIHPRAKAITQNLSQIARPDDVILGMDAGDYLCNYLYYRAREAFPYRRAVFVHIPTVQRMPMERQLLAVGSLLANFRLPPATV